MSETIVASIKVAAAKHPEKGAQFLTCNSRFSPTFLKAVREQLPGDFVMVGMPDFIALAQKAGAVTALPFSDAVGSGDSLKVSFQLHNAAGTTGGPGTLTPPDGLTSGMAIIGYKDSRFGWEKEMSLTIYPQGISVSDGEFTQGWTAADGAAITTNRGMLKITPKTILGRHDAASGTKIANNGRVSFPLKQLDFSRKPILKINIPDQDSHGTKIGVIDESGQYKECRSTGTGKVYSIDLSAATKWTGTKDLTLSLDPATSHGKYVRLRSIKVCYP